MEYDLSEEQEAFRDIVRDFASHEIAPHAEQWDRDHEFPVKTVLAMGELGLFGLIFPETYGGGSDAGATRTRAVLNGDHWVIDGSKSFITNSGTAITSIVTVTARTDHGISAIVIPSGTPGLVVEPPYRKLGW